MKTDELIEAVIMWGHEHNIDNPVMQALKVNEEVGEIATEITHNRLHGPDMIDAIGDSLVTIIILADVLGYNPIDCLQEAYDVISKRNFNRLEALKQEKNHKFDIYMENLKKIIDGDKDFNEYLQYIEVFLK